MDSGDQVVLSKWLLLVPLFGLGGCLVGGAASALRPKAPTYAGATGEKSCKNKPSDFERPLVVDLDARSRGDLEVAMKQGVVAVAYDCERVRVLPDCRISGSYSYFGMTVKQQRIQLEDADEVKANLPFSGALLGAKLEAGFKRGAALQVQLVLVGKRIASMAQIQAGTLRGECAGATHFVRAATVGSFEMTTVTSAEVGAEAGVAGVSGKAGSESEKKVDNRDGDPEACRGASPDAKNVPPRCGALVSLDLKAIGGAARALASDGAQVAQSHCAQGWVYRDLKCARPTSEHHLCKAGDLQDCRVQCDKGNIGSCANLAVMMRKSKTIPAGPQRAVALFESACAKGFDMACNNLGYMYANGIGTTKNEERAGSLLLIACTAGNAAACGNLSAVFARKGNHAQRLRYAMRGCVGGDDASCNKAGHAFLDAGKPHNAFVTFVRGCQLASGNACFNAAITSRKLNNADDKAARSLLEQACMLKQARGCFLLGTSQVKGAPGIPPDVAAGLASFIMGCGTGGPNAAACCYIGGRTFLEGQEVPKNRDWGLRLIEHGCAAGDGKSCALYKKTTGQEPPVKPRSLPMLGKPVSKGPTIDKPGSPAPAPSVRSERQPSSEVSPQQWQKVALYSGVLLGLATSAMIPLAVLQRDKAEDAAILRDRDAFGEARSMQRLAITLGTVFGVGATALLVYYFVADSKKSGKRRAQLVGGPTAGGFHVGGSWRF